MVTPLPSLTVVTGADAGRIIPLREGETTIGRSAGCLCRLDDLLVGRLHAIVAGAGGRWTLLDQADADSTSVNGRPVVQAEIHDGDEIGIGGVILRFQYSPAPASRPENRAWLSAGIPVVAVILAGIALLAALGTFRRTEEPAPIENPRMVAEAGADMDTDLSLDDGASLLIPAGGLAEGSAVSIGRVPASEREFSIPDGLELGNVYEVEAEGDLWSMAGANITLPVDIQGLTQDEYEDFQVAYYADGKWIGLPSTVNVEAGTVSAGTSHFSLFAVIRRLFDKEPEVTVLTQPVAYSDVPLEKTMDVDLDDLVTVIYVFDPEDQPVDVYFTYALGT